MFQIKFYILFNPHAMPCANFCRMSHFCKRPIKCHVKQALYWTKNTRGITFLTTFTANPPPKHYSSFSCETSGHDVMRTFSSTLCKARTKTTWNKQNQRTVRNVQTMSYKINPVHKVTVHSTEVHTCLTTHPLSLMLLGFWVLTLCGLKGRYQRPKTGRWTNEIFETTISTSKIGPP